MLSLRLEPDLEQLLEQGVDDLARYNILRFLHDRPETEGDVRFFSEELGLRPPERVGESLEALERCGLLTRAQCDSDEGYCFSLSPDPYKRDLVDRLYHLSASSLYGEIVERLAARSLRRARKAQLAGKGSCKHGGPST